jgi:putative oxidoreductase
MKLSQYEKTEIAAFLLRISLGVMWLAHAGLKFFVFTISGFAGWLENQNLPSFAAWPVFLMEVIGGILILLGVYGRYASLILLPIMAVAMSTHIHNGWAHTSAGGGWEYPLFLIIASVVHFLLGDGKYAVSLNKA